ncbi:uncharacterized protein MELLADRAFT_104628 [Melampsora larici-populina 98AG31]|uniref:Uncharacterized protein n=1 Tax=Melampsora larici-populina (strain 98AG31 / pathotype 3-4-7) TaxID=747676 RepID=F4RFC8_MELLP|nr:uncharacterized protein MELLADRAFT_104628 [Melampsora larici-populina 98AG31]EGG08792.1 hypothetical protein MELLADRAFT_104628 [Melampsora larici-populina 98AG31]
MTNAETAKAKAIRASRRVQGLDADQPPEQSGSTDTTRVNAEPDNPPVAATQLAIVRHPEPEIPTDQVDRNVDYINDEDETEAITTSNSQNKGKSVPKTNQHFIARVPIPYPVGPIREPQLEQQDSSSDHDDPNNDFLDDESESDSQKESPENASSESEPKGKISSASLGSSNEEGSDSSDSSSSSSSEETKSESDSSSEESDDSDHKSKKDKKRKKMSKVKKQLKEAKDEIRQLGKIAQGKPAKKLKKGKKKSKSSGKKKQKKGRGIQVEIGAIPNSNLVQLQPFRRKQMKKLHSSIPLTVFNQSFALADSEEYDRQHHSSSSKTTKNKGLDAPSEYKMSYGDWTENISLFKQYLIMHKHPEVAERINYHIKNVKQIKRSTECWMTALRYDILCRKGVFVEREDKHPIKDIGSFMKKYEEKAKDKSLNFGETNGGESNPYAKGGKLEFKHPETGQPINQTSSQHQTAQTQNHPIASSSRDNTFRGRRRAIRTPRPQPYQQHHNPFTNYNNNNTINPYLSPYQHFPTFHQTPLPTSHLSSHNQHPTNSTSKGDTQTGNANNMGSGFIANRGGRGSWRGGRGGAGRQGQQET